MTNALRAGTPGTISVGVVRRPPLTAVGPATTTDSTGPAGLLVDELKTLRRGRGIFTSRIEGRVGVELRALARVRPDDGPAELRVKLAHYLHALSDGLPEDLRAAALAAFAIAPDARQPLYKDRVALTAARIQRDPRTARRRIDEAIEHLAQLATARGDGLGPARPVSPWRHTELRVSLVLDRARPELVEHGQIRAEADRVTRLAFVADRIVTGPDGAPAGCVVDVLHGGVLTGRRGSDGGGPSGPRGVGPEGRPGALTPGRPLAAGDTCDYAVRAVACGPVRPQVLLAPDQPCERFVLTVRFDRANPPSRVRLIGPDPAELAVDRAGEVRAEFHRLRQGRPHGISWTP